MARNTRLSPLFGPPRLIVTLAAVCAVCTSSSERGKGPPDCSCAPQDHPGDCSALCALWIVSGRRQDLGPQWGSGATVCTWGFQHGDEYIGASCDAASRVTRLVLESLEPPLTGSLPPELGNLTAVTHLSLWQNNLTGIIPRAVAKLKNLQSLNLNNNLLSGTLPPGLGGLRELTALALADNRFVGSIPAELGLAHNLTLLFLGSDHPGGNNFTGPIPASLGGLGKLTYLDLFGNSLAGSIPAALGSLHSLTTLDLGSNALTGTIPPELALLHELSWLDLHSNRLAGPLPTAVCELVSGSGVDCDFSHNAGFDFPVPSGCVKCNAATQIV